MQQVVAVQTAPANMMEVEGKGPLQVVSLQAPASVMTVDERDPKVWLQANKLMLVICKHIPHTKGFLMQRSRGGMNRGVTEGRNPPQRVCEVSGPKLHWLYPACYRDN